MMGSVLKRRHVKARSSPMGFRNLDLRAVHSRRGAFTLFEVILSVALAAVLLALIGTAINLYLTRVDSDRTRVEEAQLARSVLAMITDDIREASVYQKQDTSAIAKLMAAGTPFDVDSIDKAREGGAATSGPGGSTAIAKLSSLSSTSGGGGSSSGGSSSTGGTSNEESDDTMPLGLNGQADDLYVDVTRMPRQEELFATVTGYTNAPSAASSSTGPPGSSASSAEAMPPADLKTVHYYIRPGNGVEAGSAAVTSLAPDAQASAGGLVREEIPRRLRVFAEQTGGTDTTTSGAALIAPEVVQLQFRYFDGSQLLDTWDMKELKKLPTAIEVCVWLRSARANAGGDNVSSTELNGAHEYRQVVYLPMSQISEASAANGSGSSSDASAADDASTSSPDSSSSGSGSAFGDL